MGLERMRGDTYADRFAITNGGTPVNLAGCTIKMTVCSVRNPTNTSTDLFELTGVVDAPATGVVYFFPDASMTNRVGLFYYDIQLTDANGIIRTLVKDTYTLTQDITK